MPFRATADGQFAGPGLSALCTLGRAGVIAAALKKEGDGASPAGIWPLRRVLYRPDRLERPETALPAAPLTPADLWCDDPAHQEYNRLVKAPFPGRAEPLWREDGLYDLLVVLGHNDAPVVPGGGSAIFWHVARPDGGPTEGCIGTALPVLLACLRAAKPGDALRIG